MVTIGDSQVGRKGEGTFEQSASRLDREETIVAARAGEEKDAKQVRLRVGWRQGGKSPRLSQSGAASSYVLPASSPRWINAQA
jgi:hypothetical protein